jgi:hypothetical protein
MSFLNSFEHLKNRKLTYIEHLKGVLSMSYSLTKANICLLIHGIYPPLFETTASGIIIELNEQLSTGSAKR